MGQSSPQRAEKEDSEHDASETGRTTAAERKNYDSAEDEEQETECGKREKGERGTRESAQEQAHRQNRQGPYCRLSGLRCQE